MRRNLPMWNLRGLIGARALWLLCLFVGLTTSVVAQGNRVCLYERANYGGQVVCIDAGESVSDLQTLTGAWGARVGSIRLIGQVRATIFEDTGFGGASYLVESDLPNLMLLRVTQLRGWRRVVSSIRVERLGYSGPGQSNDNRACVYSLPNFGGQPLCFNVGEDSADLRRARGGWNGRIASIRLFGNAQVTIFEDTAFGGASYLVTSDVADFSRLRSNELRSWRRDVSSLRIDQRRGGGQRPDRPDRPDQGDRACLYDQVNYGGQSVCFGVGQSSSELRLTGNGWNDRAMSIRIFGDVQATVYEDVGFGGASYVVSTDVPNLAQIRLGQTRGNFQRQISAIMVGGGQRPDRPDRPEQGDRACLYDQPNYGGQSVCFRVGESSSELALTGSGWNDRAMSIRIFGDVRATVYEDVGFGGTFYVVSTDIPNLAQIRLGQTRGNFQRQISAIRVERGGVVSTPTVGDAFRLGQQDYQQGRAQNYRVHRGQFDRNSELEFERDYNRGYEEARGNRPGDTTTEVFRSLNGAYSGIGQLTIGNRTQQVTDLLIRLRAGGVARFELSGEGPRLLLSGNWTEGTRGQIDLTIIEGFGAASGVSGRGRLYQRNGVFQRIELTGQTNRQNFSLTFRDDDAAWGGGGWMPGTGRPGAIPTGTVIHRGAIISQGSGKGLDVADNSTLDGASIQQWDFNRQPNQTWQIIDLGSGEVAIIAVHSNKAITVQGGRDLNGANVVQREWRNNPYQRWRLEQVSGGVYRIINVGSGKALDVAGQSRENGANIQQWDYANQRNQQWRLTR